MGDARAVLRADADDEPEEGEDGRPEEDVDGQVCLGLRHDEGEDEAGVSHDEGPPHVARVHRHPHQQAQRHHHGAREPHPARRHEHPVPASVQVAHDGVAGAVHVAAVLRLLGVLLPVPAGDVGAELVRERGDQRGHHQQRVRVVADPGVRALRAEVLLVHGRAAVRRWQLRVHGRLRLVVALAYLHLHVARGRRAWVNLQVIHAQRRVAKWGSRIGG